MKTARTCAATLFFSILSVLVPIVCTADDKVMTLHDGLKMATENSRLVKIAHREKDAYSSDLRIAFSRYLPSINASMSQTFLSRQVTAIFGPFAVPESDKSYLSYGFDARQVLYDFGGRSSHYEAASAALENATSNIERIKNMVALDFIIAYFDVLESEKMISVGEKEVERLMSHLGMAQSLYKEGAITRNDVLQAGVRLSDAQQRLLTATNLRAVNASRLNNILALPLENPVLIKDINENPGPGYENDLGRAWETAREQRVELKIIQRELNIKDLEKTEKRSEYFPSFYAEGGYNYMANHYLMHDDNWTLMLGLNLNLFNGGSTKAGIAKIDSQREQLLEQARKLADDIKLDIEKSYLDMKNADERIKVTKDAAGQAEENLRINKVRYREGVGTSTDVLDAITLLTTAETNFYRAEYEFRRAQGAFMYSIGLDLVSRYGSMSE